MLIVKNRDSDTKIIFIILVTIFLFYQKLSAQTVDNGNNGSVYQDFKTEFTWDAKVKIANRINVGESYCKSVLDLEAPKSSPL